MLCESWAVIFVIRFSKHKNRLKNGEVKLLQQSVEINPDALFLYLKN